MTKAAILRCIKEMEDKLAELRTAVEQWPEGAETPSSNILGDFTREEDIKAANNLHEVFATLRAAWNIPSDVQPDLPIEALQHAMAEGLPENWASREIMRMREE
jgi:hypothetical protein